MKKIIFPFLGVLLLAGPSFGQNQALDNTDYSTTLGTSAQQCVPGSSSRKTLTIENPYGGANNIGYCVGSSCTPIIGAAGTSVLTPGNLDNWAYGNAVKGPINCVASAGSTPVTIRSAP